jgi:hypothetical protein
MKVTKESLIEAGACYGKKRINALPIPPDGATPRRVAEYTEIPVKDRIWALCCAVTCCSKQESAHYKRQLQLFAIYCAEDVMNNEIAEGRMPHKDSLKAIEIAKKFLNGEATKEELRIAKEKAWTASAANSAALAAYNAAHEVSYEAAYNAALAAYNATLAAYNAIYYAADKDPIKLQKYLDKLVEMLEE